jgi:seryl-tRNA synthetase
MLTIKQITENTDAVLRGLEKKHFKNAQEVISQVIEANDKRRNSQNQLDKNLAEVNSLSRSVGQLMKEGRKKKLKLRVLQVNEKKEKTRN